MPSKKVVVVFHEPRAGGAVLSILRILPLLEARGWRFAFWVPRPSELFDLLSADGRPVDGAPRYIDHSVRALRLPPGPRRRLASVPPYLRAFRRFLADERPTLVHANSVLTTTEGLVAARTPARVVLHVHEMVPGGVRGWLTRRAAWSRFDAVVGVSQACARTMAEGPHFPLVVHEASPLPDDPVRLRDAANPFTIGTIGVVSQRKGTDLFVEAALRAARDNPRQRFEIVAGGIAEREREWGEQLIARAVAGGVEYVAHADVPRKLRSWDAFVLPSRVDPFPISMLEAMASGLPVIGTAVDGIVEQIVPGSGVLVPRDDPAALAAAMTSVAGMDLAARTALGLAARQRVAENFTLEHQADAMHAAYLATLGDNREHAR
jgi:glycosyltransferase involved in cell wall biosynthesis